MRMPRSSIPAVSLTLAISRLGLLASKELNSVAFLRRGGLSLRTTIVSNSGFHLAACALASPLLRTPPLSGIALRFRYSPAGYALACFCCGNSVTRASCP